MIGGSPCSPGQSYCGKSLKLRITGPPTPAPRHLAMWAGHLHPGEGVRLVLRSCCYTVHDRSCRSGSQGTGYPSSWDHSHSHSSIETMIKVGIFAQNCAGMTFGVVTTDSHTNPSRGQAEASLPTGPLDHWPADGASVCGDRHQGQASEREAGQGSRQRELSSVGQPQRQPKWASTWQTRSPRKAPRTPADASHRTQTPTQVPVFHKSAQSMSALRAFLPLSFFLPSLSLSFFLHVLFLVVVVFFFP